MQSENTNEKFVNPELINEVFKKMLNGMGKEVKPLTDEQIEQLTKDKYLYNEDMIWKNSCKGYDALFYDIKRRAKEIYMGEWYAKLPKEIEKYGLLLDYIYGAMLLPFEFDQLQNKNQRLSELTNKAIEDKAFVRYGTNKPLLLYGTKKDCELIFYGLEKVFSKIKKQSIRFFTEFSPKDVKNQVLQRGLFYIDNTDDYVYFDDKFTFRNFLQTKINQHDETFNVKHRDILPNRLKSVIITSNLVAYKQKANELVREFNCVRISL